ncbi:MAG: MerR family DNA-binding transcriptional regulator [Acidimicrobiales bacterium]
MAGVVVHTSAVPARTVLIVRLLPLPWSTAPAWLLIGSSVPGPPRRAAAVVRIVVVRGGGHRRLPLCCVDESGGDRKPCPAGNKGVAWEACGSASWPRQPGVTTKTLRFYESRGLLPVPTRTASGYRDYGEDARAPGVHPGGPAGRAHPWPRSPAWSSSRDAGAGTCEHTAAAATPSGRPGSPHRGAHGDPASAARARRAGRSASIPPTAPTPTAAK